MTGYAARPRTGIRPSYLPTTGRRRSMSQVPVLERNSPSSGRPDGSLHKPLVQQHGGPCLSLTDVDRLIVDVAGGKSQFLKNEISYQKLVLGYKSKFLKITGNVATLTQNLKNFFRCKDDPGKSQIIFDSPFLHFTTKYNNLAVL